MVPGTLQLGPKTNQTIFGMKTVCIHWVLNTNTNGMTLNAVTVISILARKVGYEKLNKWCILVQGAFCHVWVAGRMNK